MEAHQKMWWSMTKEVVTIHGTFFRWITDLFHNSKLIDILGWGIRDQTASACPPQLPFSLSVTRATTEGAAGRYSGLMKGWKKQTHPPISYSLTHFFLNRVECWAGPNFDAGTAEKVVIFDLFGRPHSISQVADSLCSSECPGAEGEFCGGQSVMDVWVTGSKNDGDE